jgi:hypothetical protein
METYFLKTKVDPSEQISITINPKIVVRVG